MTKLQAHQCGGASTWTTSNSSNKAHWASNSSNNDGEIGDRIRDCLTCLVTSTLVPQVLTLTCCRGTALQASRYFSSLLFSLFLYQSISSKSYVFGFANCYALIWEWLSKSKTLSFFLFEIKWDSFYLSISLFLNV